MIKCMLQEVNLDVGISNRYSRSLGKDVESLVSLLTSHTDVGRDQMQAKIHLYMHISAYIKAFKYK